MPSALCTNDTGIVGIETAFANLLGCIPANDASGVEQAILNLRSIECGYDTVPDKLVESLLTLLRSEKMYASGLAGYLLNFFEFEAPNLTARQKSLCSGLLHAHGDRFAHVHSRQVVAELREGNYLK
jgi:hypothetical protein